MYRVITLERKHGIIKMYTIQYNAVIQLSILQRAQGPVCTGQETYVYICHWFLSDNRGSVKCLIVFT